MAASCSLKQRLLYLRRQARYLFFLSLLLLPLTGWCADNSNTPLAWQEPRDEDLRLLEVRLDRKPLDGLITAYQHLGGVVLPLGLLCEMLDIAIQVNQLTGQAEGFILSEERRFFLDIARAELTINGKAEIFNPELVQLYPDDIYVDSQLLARWLPLDLDVDLFASRLNIRPREPLPMQLREQREKRSAFLRARQGVFYDYPEREIGYQLAEPLFIDYSAQLSHRRSSDGGRFNDTIYSAYATGDFLYMDSAWYLSGSDEDAFRDSRLTLSRKDPDGNLLGPLNARDISIGSITYANQPLVNLSQPLATGFLLSRYPLSRQTTFDTHTFHGYLLPGWEVELYHNNVLIDYQFQPVDGQYSFEEVPLLFGRNYFRLVFYGPQGQQHEETHRFTLNGSMTPPGELYYRLAGTEDELGFKRTLAQFDYGFSNRLSATVSFSRLPVNAIERSYTSYGLRTFWDVFFISADLVTTEEDGRAQELALHTRLGNWNVVASSLWLDDFTSEVYPGGVDPVEKVYRIRLDGAIPSTSWSPRFPLGFSWEEEQRESGHIHQSLENRLSFYKAGVSVSNSLHYTYGSDEGWIGNGSLQISRHLGKYRLRGAIGYGLQPTAEFSNWNLILSGRLKNNVNLNASYARSLSTDVDRVAAGINKRIGPVALGADFGYSSSGDYGINLTISGSVGREPQRPFWKSDARPMAAGGAASLRAFLDKNLNGQFDAGEEPLDNIRFHVDGVVQKSRSEKDGIAFLTRIPAYRYVDLGIHEAALEDPLWQPGVEGLRYVPRPGKVVHLNMPVIETGEVDGTVYFRRGDRERVAGNVRMQLLDARGKVVQRVKSEYDGFYLFSKIMPGSYQLRPDPEQMERLGLLDVTSLPAKITNKQLFVSGQDFVLSLPKPPEVKPVPIVVKQAPELPAIEPPSPPLAPIKPVPEPFVEPVPEPEPKPRPKIFIYTVVKDESLWRIARRLCGRGWDAYRIYAANSNSIYHPDLIYPGQRLLLPKGVCSNPEKRVRIPGEQEGYLD